MVTMWLAVACARCWRIRNAGRFCRWLRRSTILKRGGATGNDRERNATQRLPTEGNDIAAR